jgi:hypothetical protein
MYTTTQFLFSGAAIDFVIRQSRDTLGQTHVNTQTNTNYFTKTSYNEADKLHPNTPTGIPSCSVILATVLLVRKTRDIIGEKNE